MKIKFGGVVLVLLAVLFVSGCSNNVEISETNAISIAPEIKSSGLDDSSTSKSGSDEILASNSLKQILLSADVIDDEGIQNISSALPCEYSAYEEKTDPKLVYIERNPGMRTEQYFGPNPDRLVIDMNALSPMAIIDLAEKEFAGKYIRYHCVFTGKEKESLDEISRVLSKDVEVTTGGLGFKLSLYLTKDEIDNLCNAEIGNVVMDFELVDENRFMVNYPEEYKIMLGNK